jgi:hypothetical protein
MTAFLLKCAGLAGFGAVLLFGNNFSADGPPNDFNEEKAQEKMDYILEKLGEDNSSGPWTDGGIRIFIKSFLSQTQDHVSDELPSSRGNRKYIHAVGAVVKARFDWNAAAAEFTGLFRGAEQCLLRFSSATTPPPLVPGVVVKCLRDGVQSGDFVAMWQLDGFAQHPEGHSQSCSFFCVPFMTHVEMLDSLPFKQKLLAKAFAQVDPAPNFVSLHGFAEFTQDGEKESNPKFPFALFFKPTPQAAAIPCKRGEDQEKPPKPSDALQQLLAISPGTALYEVFAVRKPFMGGSGSPDMVHVGSVTAEAPGVTSKYGDENLFIRHDFFARDLEVYPEWAPLAKNSSFKATEGPMKYERFATLPVVSV